MATEAGLGPRLVFQGSSGFFWSWDFDLDFDAREMQGSKSRRTVVGLEGILVTPFCPQGNCSGSLEGAGRFDCLFNSRCASTSPCAQDVAMNRTDRVTALVQLPFFWGGNSSVREYS